MCLVDVESHVQRKVGRNSFTRVRSRFESELPSDGSFEPVVHGGCLLRSDPEAPDSRPPAPCGRESGPVRPAATPGRVPAAEAGVPDGPTGCGPSTKRGVSSPGPCLASAHRHRAHAWA